MLNLASKRYMLFLSATMCLPLLIVFLINCLLDPLWYLNGNLITNQNYAFNERLSKMNRFLNNPHDYDCFIFGSSRTTLLNEKKIKDYTCFNFSFSAGLVGEFFAFATYLKNKGYQPKLVIVGVDGFNFFVKDVEKTIPDYIIQNKPAPSMASKYLSIDALKLSYRALIGKSPLARYYKSDFSADILPDTPPYNPEKNNSKGRANNSNNNEHNTVFFIENIQWYKKIVNLFTTSEVIFYVPPISIWKIIDHKNTGKLDNYIYAIHSVSNIGHILYDFSLPSNITKNKSRTYDGSHYDLKTNGHIVNTFNTGSYSFGIRVNGLSHDKYRKNFLDAIKN